MKYTFSLFISSLLILSINAHAQVQKINTIAGNGTFGFSGDGLTATTAQFHGPIGVALAPAGEVFVLDFFNSRVRKINLLGKINTIAGNGTGGYTGDNSVGTSAQVFAYGIAVDKNSNLFIADANYGVIRKVLNTTGIITTVAGTGVPGYTGDHGPASAAKLGSIHGICFDPKGNMYVADAGHHSVRKISTSGIITTIAGGVRSYTGGDTSGYFGDLGPATAALLDSPYAVAADKNGNVFITDYRNNVIRKVDSFGVITTYAGVAGSYGYAGDAGAAASALLGRPVGIAVDTNGFLYIADAENNVIRRVDTFGIISTIVGNGTAGFGGDLSYVNGCNLFNPYGVAVDVYGSIYIADANNQRIRKTYSTVGIDPVTMGEGIIVYPNPANNAVTVGGLSKSDNVCLYDMTGRQVSQMWTVSNNATQTISVGNLVNGLYLLRVADANGSTRSVVKFIKN